MGVPAIRVNNWSGVHTPWKSQWSEVDSIILTSVEYRREGSTCTLLSDNYLNNSNNTGWLLPTPRYEGRILTFPRSILNRKLNNDRTAIYGEFCELGSTLLGDLMLNIINSEIVKDFKSTFQSSVELDNSLRDCMEGQVPMNLPSGVSLPVDIVEDLYNKVRCLVHSMVVDLMYSILGGSYLTQGTCKIESGSHRIYHQFDIGYRCMEDAKLLVSYKFCNTRQISF